MITNHKPSILFFKSILFITILSIYSCIGNTKRSEPCKINYTSLKTGEFSLHLNTLNVENCSTDGECGKKQVFYNNNENPLRIHYKVFATNSDGTKSVHIEKKDFELQSKAREYVICEKQCNTDITYVIDVISVDIRTTCN